MNKQKILDVADQYYNDVVHSELNSGMIFGCDCGCGGDSFDDTMYDALVKEEEAGQKAYDALMKELDIDSDAMDELMEAAYHTPEKPEMCEYYEENPEDFKESFDIWVNYDRVLNEIITLLEE